IVPCTHIGRAYVFERDQGGSDAWGQVADLQTPDQNLEGSCNGRFFGQAVAIAGDWVFIGETGPFGGFPGLERGRVHVFHRDTPSAGSWGFVKTIFNPDPAAGDTFGGSLGADGDTLVVGAAQDDNANGVDAGAAYVFQRDEGAVDNWGLVHKLLASDGVAGDRLTFIGGAAISGDTVVVGSCGQQNVHAGIGAGNLLGCTAQAGRAYVFERDGCGPDSWCETKILAASDGHPGDAFGMNGVAVHGDRIVIGAHGNDDFGNNAGAVYLYERNLGGPDMWGEVARLTPSDLAPNDQSGQSVAVHGTTIAAASPLDDNGLGIDAGAVYILAAGEVGSSLDKELTQGPDVDTDGEIDLVVEVGQTVATEIELTISWVPDPLGPDALILDAVPAEWQVVGLNGLGSADSCIAGSDGNGGEASAAPANGKCNQEKAATKIEWTPATAGDLIVSLESRSGKGGAKALFSPTSCGALVVNDGAVAVTLDDEGNVIYDGGDPVVLLGPTDPVVLVAVADVDGSGTIARDGSGDEDGDGVTDADEALGQIATDPCNADSDGDGVDDGTELAAGTEPNSPDSDGDGVGDGQDLCPLEGVAGSIDADGCPL
ncbi:MAG: FG-GAP repeat protein, partial [Thermoanaerobaculia bacterium]|nr:FG-GAP repeat protein [Thermoanaerobaculia bacterium]